MKLIYLISRVFLGLDFFKFSDPLCSRNNFFINFFFQEVNEEAKTEENETIEKEKAVEEPIEDAKPTPEEVVETTSEEKKEEKGTEE